MKKSSWLLAAAVWAGMGLFAVSASADTLQLKDGTVVQGTFLDGNQSYINFVSNGQTKQYDLNQIISITFTSYHGESSAQPQTSSAPPPAASSTNDYNRANTPNPSNTQSAAYPPSPANDMGSGANTATTTVTVPAGTSILVRMIDSVDSDTNHVGDRFRASLEQDLVVDGIVVAHRGTDVYGRLAEAKEAGHIQGKSQLKLELTDLLIGNRLQPIMTGDYEVSGSSRGANTAKKVGGGAVLGAIIGAIAGGGKGAAIGAGVGAGAGTAVQVLTKGEQVHVPSETLLDFRITQPFTVQVPANE